MMDGETRFWIAQVADSKNNPDTSSLFRKSNAVAGKKPTKLITDGLPAYRQAFQKEYWTRNSPRIEMNFISHSKVIGITTKWRD